MTLEKNAIALSAARLGVLSKGQTDARKIKGEVQMVKGRILSLQTLRSLLQHLISDFE